jgi:tRNA threonylcarbamoyladenosine biosynthesis protein TsaE
VLQEQAKMGTDKSSFEIVSDSPARTFNIGCFIGQQLSAGDIIALTGELGAGKTSLTQGIASGLGVSKKYQITSPTFTLVNEYPGRLALYHVDVYRLAGSDDLLAMGYEDFFFGKGVTVIEWAEKIRDILPEESYLIRMIYVDENTRKIEIKGNDQVLSALVNELNVGGY